MNEPMDRVEQAGARVGAVLDDRWTLDSLLGIGGMAAVYLATAGAERVAIKVLHPDLTRSQRALDRFRREGEVLRESLHPAVPRVHGEGTTDDGCPYLIMDLLLGETVEARRRRFGGRLAWAEVVRIALAVLDVLETVHALGVLHRDVKPSNILWLDDGSIHLIDFGIAKPLERDDARALTRTGELPGSLPFMSPEHALGLPTDLDPRSDLWSLGASMFLLLAGRPVHESPTEVGALALSASRPAPSLGGMGLDGLPTALVAIVDRALAFDREDRFLDASEMREALVGLDGSAIYRAPPRLRPIPVALPAALTLLAVVGLGAWSFGGARGPSAPLRTASGAAAVSSTPPALPTPREATPLAKPERSQEPEPAPSTPPSGDPAPTARLTRRDRPAPVASASAETRAPNPCDPPFVIDPTTGTRRVKPGC